jgi:hypothetical protein
MTHLLKTNRIKLEPSGDRDLHEEGTIEALDMDNKINNL